MLVFEYHMTGLWEKGAEGATTLEIVTRDLDTTHGFDCYLVGPESVAKVGGRVGQDVRK